jgi:hypothetical protein
MGTTGHSNYQQIKWAKGLVRIAVALPPKLRRVSVE